MRSSSRKVTEFGRLDARHLVELRGEDRAHLDAAALRAVADDLGKVHRHQQRSRARSGIDFEIAHDLLGTVDPDVGDRAGDLAVRADDRACRADRDRRWRCRNGDRARDGTILFLPSQVRSGRSARSAQAAGPTPSTSGLPVGTSGAPGQLPTRRAATGRSSRRKFGAVKVSPLRTRKVFGRGKSRPAPRSLTLPVGRIPADSLRACPPSAARRSRPKKKTQKT